MWQWTRLLTVDTIFVVVVIALLIYFLITVKKKKHEFIGFDTNLTLEEILQQRVKPTKKKRKGKHEERCREIFTNIFGKRFKSVRPDWLKNPATGKNLELDGYCPDIQTPEGTGLAFEYDGGQHAKYNSHFHQGNPKAFVYQMKKDSYKTMRCKERGVMLIRIPHEVIFEDLERHIKMKLAKHGIYK